MASFHLLRRHRDFWALRDVSFSVHRGETLCVIGENGSGKSTLLQIVAGILQPTSGSVHVGGRVAALLELGAGFNPEFTGRENVYLNSALHGLSRAEIDQRFASILEFAEIGGFIDRPVKTYSSGMLVRLAFAAAIHTDPEVLLVDEALAVGDVYFRQRCLRKVHELRARGTTIIFVSHSTADVKAVGDRAMWLHRGAVRAIGDTEAVVSRYIIAMDGEASPSPNGRRPIGNMDARRGDGRVQVTALSICDAAGQPTRLLEPASPFLVRMEITAQAPVERPRAGFLIRNHLGLDFAGTDTEAEGSPLEPLLPGERRQVEFRLDLPHIYGAHFSFSPFVADGPADSGTMCDWIDNAVTLEAARGEQPVYGYIHIPCRVELNARLRSDEH